MDDAPDRGMVLIPRWAELKISLRLRNPRLFLLESTGYPIGVSAQVNYCPNCYLIRSDSVKNAVWEDSAYKSMKSLHLSVDPGGDFQAFDISAQAGGKVIAESTFLCLVK